MVFKAFKMSDLGEQNILKYSKAWLGKWKDTG